MHSPKGPLPQKTKTNPGKQPESPSKPIAGEAVAESPISNTKCDTLLTASNPIIPHFVYSQ